MLLFALLGATESYVGQRLVGRAVREPAVTDVWFDGDVPRVAVTLADRWHEKHQRATVHPLLPSATLATYVVRGVAGVDRAASVTAVIAAIGFLWAGTLVVLLRVVGCGRADAALLAALGLAGAATLFWLAVPESFALGSVSIMLGLLPAALAARGWRPRERWFVAASAASFAVTTTNWMAGLLSAASAFSWRRALQISVNAFAAVTLLWGVQKVLVPHAGFFLERLQNEQQFTARPTPERIGEVARAFFVRSMVAPTPAVTGRDYPLVPAPSAGEENALAADAAGPPAMAHGHALTMQRAPGQGTPWGWLATAAWLALLGIGVWSMRDLPALGRFRAVVVLFLAGQLGLHLIYGKETFLYALDYFPALLLLAAFALLGPRRRVARVCAALTLLGASVDNVRQLRGAAAFVATEAATVGVAPQSAPPSRPEEPGALRR